jgi:hypothetical protein
MSKHDNPAARAARQEGGEMTITPENLGQARRVMTLIRDGCEELSFHIIEMEVANDTEYMLYEI